MGRFAGLALVLVAGAFVHTPAAQADARGPVCHGRVATIVGTDGPDRLIGTPGPDVIVALGGYDRVWGRGGDDVICGGTGHNDLYGGRGDDLLYGGVETINFLSGGPGDDRLVSGGRFLVTMHGGPGDDVERVRGGHGGWLLLTDDPGHNIVTVERAWELHLDLSGSRVPVHVDAHHRGFIRGVGDTRLRLAHGCTLSMVGTRFADTIVGSPGKDTVDGGAGNDVIRTGAERDVITPNDGRNVVDAGAGRDLVYTERDPIESDIVHAGPGRDSIEVNSRSQAYGGPGDDDFNGILAPGSAERVDGGPGHNRLGWVSVPPEGRVGPWHHVVLDLGHDRLTADGRMLRLRGLFTHLELVKPHTAARWTLNGTGGRDVLEVRNSDATEPFVMHGRGGGDLLVSASGDDVLWGGPGFDRAVAGAGDDTCHSIAAPGLGDAETYCETTLP